MSCHVISRLLALTLVLLSTFLLVKRGWPVFDDELLKMTAPDVPEKYNGELQVGGKGGVYWTVDGKQHYQMHYTKTWNECRDAFYHGRDLYYENETDQIGPWSSVVPGNMFDAQRLGWTACRTQIEHLRKQFSDSQLRRRIVIWPYFEFGILLAGLLLAGASLFECRTVDNNTLNRSREPSGLGRSFRG